MEDAVVEGGHDAVADAVGVELLADFAVQDVRERVGVGDGGDHGVRERGFEQEPRIVGAAAGVGELELGGA